MWDLFQKPTTITVNTNQDVIIFLNQLFYPKYNRSQTQRGLDNKACR